MSNWYQRNVQIDALPIDDRAIHYGDGLFETVAIRDGAPRLWSLHMGRLRRGCDILGLPMPDESALQASVNAAINAAGLSPDYALAKIIVSAGRGPRGYRRTAAAACDPLIGVFPASPLPAAFYTSGVNVRLCDTRLADQPLLAGLKTLNRLEQVLARNEWREPDIFEGLMLDSDENIICGTMSNVFAIRNQSVSTPDLSRSGVAGVMRQHVIHSLRSASIAVTEEALSRDTIMGADALFLSNSQFGVLPVSQCDGRSLPGDAFFRDVVAAVQAAGLAEPGL